MKTNYKSKKRQSRTRINNSKKLQKSKLYKKNTTQIMKHGNNLNKKTIKKKIKQVKQIGGTFRTLPNGDILSRQFLSFTNGQYVYEVTPYPLNAMVLQDLCNRRCIDITGGKVSFTENTPCLVVKKRIVTPSSGTKVLAKENKFVTVYEGPDVTKASITGTKLSIPVKDVMDDSKTELQITSDISYALQLLKSINNPGEQSSNDLQHERFNIEFDFVDDDGNDIKILGYPDPKHMTPLLNNQQFMKSYIELADFQKKGYLEWLIDLFNYGERKETKSNGAPPLSPLKTANGIINSPNESYKLVMSGLIKASQYLTDFADEKEQEKIIQGYLDELKGIMLDDKIFNRPNCRIKYQFLLFKKGADGQYDFLLKNVRELTPNHRPILKKVLDLIQTEIPRKFGLLLSGETRYENFYSYTELGKLFSIVTEFLHPTTRLETFGYLYKQRITLEELIYSSGLNVKDKSSASLPDVPFWSMNKIEYPTKTFNLTRQLFTYGDGDEELEGLNNSCENNRSLQKGGAIINKNIDLSGATIIMCNLLSSFSVKIIYRAKDGTFWTLVLAANIQYIYYDSNVKESFYRIKEFVHSSNLEDMFLYVSKVGLNICEVTEHSPIITNFFKTYTTNFILNFPVIRHKKVYDYIYQEERPRPIQDFFDKAMDLLKEDKKPHTRNFKDDQNNEFTILTNNEHGQDDTYHAFKIGDFIILEIHHTTEKTSTLWIFDNSSPQTSKRLKNIFNLNNPEILQLLLIVLKELGRFSAKTHSLYVNTISLAHTNQLHLKIVPYDNNDLYKSLLCKNEISQTVELRSLSINNVISNMSLNQDYYKGFFNNGLVLYASYLLQFIPPLLPS